MPGEINALLQKILSSERDNGLMSIFVGLSREQQVALMEWSRNICIQLASFIEKQGNNAPQLELPAPKPYIELALKTGVIRAISTQNEELTAGCESACRSVLGDAKLKHLIDFKDIVILTQQLTKW